MLKNTSTQPIVHGENMLVPVAKLPKGATKVTLDNSNTDGEAYIFGHSETGHNHLIEAEKMSDLAIFSTADGQIYIKVNNEAKITHKKSFDIHQPVEVAPGIYKVNKKTEYSPFTGLVREVYD